MGPKNKNQIIKPHSRLTTKTHVGIKHKRYAISYITSAGKLSPSAGKEKEKRSDDV